MSGFPNPIAFNILANNWAIEEQGYSNEEWKMMKETHKILGDDSIESDFVKFVQDPEYGPGGRMWDPREIEECIQHVPVAESDPEPGDTESL